jgi:hypothetical protein
MLFDLVTYQATVSQVVCLFVSFVAAPVVSYLVL